MTAPVACSLKYRIRASGVPSCASERARVCVKSVSMVSSATTAHAATAPRASHRAHGFAAGVVKSKASETAKKRQPISAIDPSRPSAGTRRNPMIAEPAMPPTVFAAYTRDTPIASAPPISV